MRSRTRRTPWFLWILVAVLLGSAGAGYAAAPAPAPAGTVSFFDMYHKTAQEVMGYLKEFHPDYVNKGMVKVMEKSDRTLVIVADAKTTTAIGAILSKYDSAGLKLVPQMIKLKHVAPQVALESLGIAGVCQVWFRSNEHKTQSWKVGKKTMTFQQVAPKYTQWEPAQFQKPGGEVLPFVGLPEVPYVCEMAQMDSFEPPPLNMDMNTAQRHTVRFDLTSSSEDRNRLMVIGTEADCERIQAFLDTVDRPAKQVMIEVQVVEMEAEAASDIGLDSVGFGKRHSVVHFNTTFPGEPIPIPGLDGLTRPGKVSIPDPVREGFQYLFDDSSIDITGQFMGAVRMLARKGKAKIRHRPKILTLDDRQNVLHIGSEVPTFTGTAVTHDSQEGNLVSKVNSVTKQYVGTTLNLRPRIAGDKGKEVVMQMDIQVNELGDRQRVFAEDLLGVPTIAVRRFTGMARVKNHTPIILGGIIREEEHSSSSYIPILGELPLIGNLFGRNYENKARMEIIIIITPHVLEKNDPMAMPRESVNFDTQDSVLFNDRYILRGKDLVGVDHSTGEPVKNDKETFNKDEVFDLSLLRIVKHMQLVTKLDIFDGYLPKEASKLSWYQRAFPEDTVHNWDKEDQKIYYQAAAHVIETIKNLNVSLDYYELVSPRREIILPTSAHRVSLTYDNLKNLYERGYVALRGEGKLDKETLDLMKEATGRSFAEFARYVERVGVTADNHGELKDELLRMYQNTFPAGEKLSSLEYCDLFRELDGRNFNFMTLYAFFIENQDRYEEVGQPKLKNFSADLKLFLRMSVPISEKAKRLQELEEKWNQYQVGDNVAQSN